MSTDLAPVLPAQAPARLPAPATDAAATAYARLPAAARATAEARLVVLRAVEAVAAERGISTRKSIELLLARIGSGRAVPALAAAAERLAREGGAPSMASVYRWCSLYKEGGLLRLAPQYKGSTPRRYDWEARAVALYNRGGRPSAAAVARQLQREGHAGATHERVRAVIERLPSELGPEGRARTGAKDYRDHHTFRRRDLSDLLPGDVWQGDGHTCDVYIEHPLGRRVFRAELTAWIDVRSRYIVGWWLSEAESAHTTLFALSSAVLGCEYIPAMLHVDRGSGYVAQMHTDEATGLITRLGCDLMLALPRNAKGKGHIERWFRLMEDEFGRFFDSYCGQDAAAEPLKQLLAQYKRGERRLPTLEQYQQALREWIDWYNHGRAHGELDGRVPAEVWAARAAVEWHAETAPLLFWPRAAAVVARSEVRLHSRHYRAPELAHLNGREVHVEYSVHDDRVVRVLDPAGRWLCDATLSHKPKYLPASRIEESRQRRLDQQIKRLENHAAEKRARAGRVLSAADAVGRLAQAGALLDAPVGDSADDDAIALDITAPLPRADDIDAIDLDLEMDWLTPRTGQER